MNYFILQGKRVYTLSILIDNYNLFRLIYSIVIVFFIIMFCSKKFNKKVNHAMITYQYSFFIIITW